MITTTLLVLGTLASFDNNLPYMYGSVSGPSGGTSLQTGVAFDLEGYDLDDQGSTSRMNHSGSANSQPSDTSAPGTLQTWDLLASNPSTGYKHWQALYTLIEVPADQVYYKTFKGTLTDNESEFSTWLDPSVFYSKSIAIAGPVSGGGGGEGN